MVARFKDLARSRETIRIGTEEDKMIACQISSARARRSDMEQMSVNYRNCYKIRSLTWGIPWGKRSRSRFPKPDSMSSRGRCGCGDTTVSVAY